jgi:SAM-dependent methyltransferase
VIARDEEPRAALSLPRDDPRLGRAFTVDPRLLGLDADTACARVLDLGAGAGRHEQATMRLPVTTVACDIDWGDLRDGRYFVDEAAREHGQRGPVEWVQGSGFALPFRDGTFDAVVCSETLEHVFDDMAMLRELRRVTRRGGRLAVSVPAYWPELVMWACAWAVTHTEGGHIRLYRRAELLAKLRRCGWRPYAVRHRHSAETLNWGLGAIEHSGRSSRLVRRVIDSRWYQRSRLADLADQGLARVLGKSLVVYATAV